MCEVTPSGEEVSSATLLSRGGFLLGMAGGAAGPGPWMSQWAAPGTQRRQPWQLVMPHFSFVCIAFSEWRHFSVAFFILAFAIVKYKK